MQGVQAHGLQLPGAGMQAKAEQLQEGIRILDARLRGVVLARQGELMAQADRLREADGAMQARLLASLAAALNVPRGCGEMHPCDCWGGPHHSRCRFKYKPRLWPDAPV